MELHDKTSKREYYLRLDQRLHFLRASRVVPVPTIGRPSTPLKNIPRIVNSYTLNSSRLNRDRKVVSSMREVRSGRSATP